MSLLDVYSLGSMELWLSALTLLAALTALAASIRVARRVSRERQRLDGMRRDLQAFAEASTRVADTLDHLLRGTVQPVEGSSSSRRYLLLQAREGLEQGEAIDALAARLDLCEDEKQLLQFLQRSRRPEQLVGVA
jgi:hypothetical protein